MKTKVVITDIIDFILGILLFFIAFTELILFCITSDADKMSILFLALSLGLRHMKDSTTKINLKKESSYKCCANCSYAEFTGIACSGKIEVICTKNKVLPIIEEPGRHKCEYYQSGTDKVTFIS